MFSEMAFLDESDKKVKVIVRHINKADSVSYQPYNKAATLFADLLDRQFLRQKDLFYIEKLGFTLEIYSSDFFVINPKQKLVTNTR